MTEFLPGIAALAYVAQLVAKSGLALRYASRQPKEHVPAPADQVSLVTSILSGDPGLAALLEENLLSFGQSQHLWLVDEDDAEGMAITGRLQRLHPAIDLRVLQCPPPSQGLNPKAIKLAHALPLVTRKFLVVLDDDTRLNTQALTALLCALDKGACLATVLPSYHAAKGWCSEALAEFVNSSAILSYLPALNFGPALTLNGMCYAMRSAEIRELRLFERIERSLTDDLAVARVLRREKRVIHQTITPVKITTTVPDTGALLRLLHRWFFFTRLLLETEASSTRLFLFFCYGLPPLLLWVCIALCLAGGNWLLLVLLLVSRALLLALLQHHFYRRASRHLLLSLFAELIQPPMLVWAQFSRKIRWRKHRIAVRSNDDFSYL